MFVFVFCFVVVVVVVVVVVDFYSIEKFKPQAFTLHKILSGGEVDLYDVRFKQSFQLIAFIVKLILIVSIIEHYIMV